MKRWLFFLLVALQIVTPQVWGAPGDIIFEENFDDAGWASDWEITQQGEADRSTQTSETGAYALYTGEDTVDVTLRSGRADLDGRSARIRFWVRRGSDSFSEDPDSGEDLVVSYLNSSGAWRTLVQYLGDGTEGETYVFDQELPVDASHANFRVRFSQLDGSGDGWDYWHVDTVRITESSWIPGEILFEETFEDRGWGTNWRTSRQGDADRSTQTAESGSYSGYLSEDAVRVTLRNRRVNLENQPARLRFWIRRGSDSFSENPDSGEDLRVRYRNNRGRWVTLVQYSGSGTQGEVFIFDQVLPDEALHSNFRMRFELLDGSGTGYDFWHVDNIRITGAGTAAVSVPVVDHDQSGSYCSEESVSLQVVDDVGNVQTDFVGAVTLSTSTNLGSWRRLVAQGSLVDGTADDGAATYSFVAADAGEVTLGLTYNSGAGSVDVDMTIVETGASDDDSEGPLVFAPQSFVVTSSAVANGATPPYTNPLSNQVAETSFQLHITAVSGGCGVTSDYSGSRQFDVWQNLLNPTSGTRQINLAGTAVGSSISSPVRQTYVFTNGRAALAGSYADVGRLSLGFSEVATSSNFTTDEFVVRPASMVITQVTDDASGANPGTSTLNGTVFTTAGSPLRITVEARGASQSLLPNFGLESPAETVVVNAQVLAPVGGVSRMSNAAAFVRTAPGRFLNTTASFDEVGVISLQASIADGNYLGSGDVIGNVVSPVGRFAVDRFALTSANVAAACTTFTYMDQDALILAAEVEARSARDERTLNYDRTLYGVSPLETVSIRGENANDGIDLGARFSFTPPQWAQGRWLLNATDASFSKLANPDGAYDQLQLSVAVTELLEGAALEAMDSNPATTGDCSASANCSSRAIGTTQIRYGRLAQPPVQGPEDKALSIPIVAEYWDQGFKLNGADSCTVYDTATASLSDYTGDLSSGETVLTAPLGQFSLSNGVGSLGQRATLSAPGFGNRGSVRVTHLAPFWMQFDWSGSGATSPSALATFGQFRGHDRVLVWREVSR